MEREDENENSKFLSLSSSADLKRHEGGNETKLTDRYRKNLIKFLHLQKIMPRTAKRKLLSIQTLKELSKMPGSS